MKRTESPFTGEVLITKGDDSVCQSEDKPITKMLDDLIAKLESYPNIDILSISVRMDVLERYDKDKKKRHHVIKYDKNKSVETNEL